MPLTNITLKNVVLGLASLASNILFRLLRRRAPKREDAVVVVARLIGLIAALFGLGASDISTAQTSLLRIATTTSVDNSGLLARLLPRFEAETGHRVELSVVGSGTALRLGRLGQVDVILVHAPDAEERFVRRGYGVERVVVMHNDFLIVGPPEDPASVSGYTDAAQALYTIAASGSVFFSRGDDSGTNKKELELWRELAIDPYGNDWYMETGVGMGKTLELASRENAYTICDRGTWLALRKQLELRVLVYGDSRLLNTYSVIAVNSDRHPSVNRVAARRFIEWLTSPQTQHFIGQYRVDGEQLFVPEWTTD